MLAVCPQEKVRRCFVGDRTVLLQCHVNAGLHCNADRVGCYGDERKASLNSPLYVAVRLKLL